MSPLDFETYKARIRAAVVQMSAAIAETDETADRAREIVMRQETVSLRIVSR